MEAGGGAAGEDDYGDFEGAQVEDDAPESVQALAGPSPWATFPDLVRVPANNSTSSSSACAEEDAPESQLPFALRGRAPFASNHSAAEGVSGSGSGASGRANRETGAIPKATSRQSVAPPPDVSLAASQPSSSATARLPNSLSGNDLLSSTGANSNQGGRNPGAPEDRVHSLERDIVSLRTQNAVLHQQLNQKDNKLRDLREANAPSQLTPATSQVLLNVAASVATLQTSFEAMASEVTQRLTLLEARLNKLVVTDNQSLTLDATGAIREELRSLRAQQRKVRS